MFKTNNEISRCNGNKLKLNLFYMHFCTSLKTTSQYLHAASTNKSLHLTDYIILFNVFNVLNFNLFFGGILHLTHFTSFTLYLFCSL